MEHKSKETPEDPAKRLLLKRLAVMAVGATLLPNIHASDGGPQPPEPPKIDERERLKKEILEKYGITVFDPDVPISTTQLFDAYKNDKLPLLERKRLLGVYYNLAFNLIRDTANELGERNIEDLDITAIKDKERLVMGWSRDNLNSLRSFLNILPDQFLQMYRPKDSNILELYLVDARRKDKTDNLELNLDFPDSSLSADGFTGSCGGCGQDVASIRLSSDQFNRDPVWSIRTLFHELTHRILLVNQVDEVDIITIRAFKAIGIDIPQTKENDTRTPVAGLLERFLATGEISHSNKNGKVEDRPHSYVAYGIMDFEEFLPIAVRVYSDGREKFLQDFGRSFSQEEANRLYEFIKTEFFGGREYEQGEIDRVIRSAR